MELGERKIECIIFTDPRRLRVAASGRQPSRLASFGFFVERSTDEQIRGQADELTDSTELPQSSVTFKLRTAGTQVSYSCFMNFSTCSRFIAG